MVTFEYNPFADFVTITYFCPTCGHKNIESFAVPTPDWTAESHHKSVNSDVVAFYCDHCGGDYKMELATGIYGGEGKIQGIEDISVVAKKQLQLLIKLTFLTKNQNVFYIGYFMLMSLLRWNYILKTL